MGVMGPDGPMGPIGPRGPTPDLQSVPYLSQVRGLARVSQQHLLARISQQHLSSLYPRIARGRNKYLLFRTFGRILVRDVFHWIRVAETSNLLVFLRLWRPWRSFLQPCQKNKNVQVRVRAYTCTLLEQSERDPSSRNCSGIL